MALRRWRGAAFSWLTVTSAALLGASSSARAPECAAMLSGRIGALQEPLAATARPASSTPPVALCEGAVRRQDLRRAQAGAHIQSQRERARARWFIVHEHHLQGVIGPGEGRRHEVG